MIMSSFYITQWPFFINYNIDFKKWKRIKRSGGFRRRVNKNYQLLLLNIQTVPTYNLEETVPSQEQSGKNGNGSLHFSTLNAENAGSSQDWCSTNQTCSDYQGILDSENVLNYSDFSEEDNSLKSSDESSEEFDKDDQFRQDLKKWAITCNVAHDTVKKVCEIINRRLPHILPKDPRTFLQTKTISLIPLDKGFYWHNGVTEQLKKYLELLIIIPESISLNINIDGLPIYKSSREQVWSILCNIFEIPYLSPFAVGIYSGKGKPQDLEGYFRPFVTEMKELLRNSLKVTTKYGK
ncbi:unnamed protein product [Diatraea saccharalis]|uniref:Uncharacterized protein n=1 Tax=Diatraea saccharalis TaxID=40085 RepID=A0A9N9N2D1_9NEOP|nr:unnamed protein product [Diatraea saccharalis]CAG9793047.1 unnamed protein product [Diatraea saccharalis]